MMSSEFLKSRNHVIDTSIKTSALKMAEFIELMSSLITLNKNKSKLMKEVLSSFLKICECFEFKITINLNSEI